MIAYMIIDNNGYCWYYDTKEEMLESVRLGNIGIDPETWNYYELNGTPRKLGELSIVCSSKTK